MSYMADQLALFGIVVGVALLLSGVGFVVLALVVLGVRVPRRLEAGSHELATPAPTT